jgi:hypothetical protein
LRTGQMRKRRSSQCGKQKAPREIDFRHPFLPLFLRSI